MTKTEGLIVFGASGHGKVVADAAIASGVRVLGFADDDERKRDLELLGLPVLAIGLEELAAVATRHRCRIALGIGSNTARRAVLDRLTAAALSVASVTHPSAIIAPSATLGVGTVAFGNVVVNPGSRVGQGVILNTAASVDHDCVINDFVHLSPGAHLGGAVSVGTGSHLGVGVSVRNNISIGEWTVVGVGAAVVSDIPDRVVCYGNPARVAHRKS